MPKTRTPDTSPEGRLQTGFAADFIWPLNQASLAALSDIGLSDADIGGYFGVDESDVARLHRRYAKRRFAQDEQL